MKNEQDARRNQEKPLEFEFILDEVADSRGEDVIELRDVVEEGEGNLTLEPEKILELDESAIVDEAQEAPRKPVPAGGTYDNMLDLLGGDLERSEEKGEWQETPQRGVSLSEAQLEAMITRVVEEVVERVVRRTVAEATEKVIGQAIEALRESLEGEGR